MFYECSHERDGTSTLDINDFFNALRLMADQQHYLDIEHEQICTADGHVNPEITVAFASVTGDGDATHIGLDQWLNFVFTANRYVNWNEKDPPVELTLFQNDEFLMVFNVYVFYALVVIAQMILPAILLYDWSGGNLGDDKGALTGDQFSALDTTMMFKQILRDPNRMAYLALCTNEMEMIFKFAVACVFSFLILLTDVGNAAVNTERRTWGRPLRCCSTVSEEDEESMKSNSPFRIAKHSHMTADPSFYELGDVWNLSCYCLIVSATYVMMQASGTLDNVLKDIIAVNFLIELDNLVCQIVLTDTHLEIIEAKLILAYLIYGERTDEELEVLDHTGGLWSCIKKFIDVILSPILLVGYYFTFVTPMMCFLCY